MLKKFISVSILIGFSIMSVACDALQTPTMVPPTPTPKVPEYEANEVIGIVQNRMKMDCGPESPLARINAYRAIAVYDYKDELFGNVISTPTLSPEGIFPASYSEFYRDNMRSDFSGKWKIIWPESGDRPNFEWEFFEDSKTVVQISRGLGRYC